MASFEVVLGRLREEETEQYLGNIFMLSQFKIFVKFFNVQTFAVAVKKKAPFVHHV